MEDRSNKTVMCSVLFLDIVAYSKKSVSDQIILKEAFNTMLSNAIKDVPANDRVILDTGDGAAISFLGDVEDALKTVLAFRESLLGEGANMNPQLQVCMGINLGPVRMVKDINGRPNIVGDGINVAQRVMGFAKPGQILVSRSYFDAAARLSQEYAGMFYAEGSRTDKHVREHEVYAIGFPGDANRQAGGEDTLGIATSRNTVQGKGGAVHGAGGLIKDVHGVFLKATSKQRAMYIGIAGVLLGGLVAAVIIASRPPEIPAPEVVVEAPVKPIEVQAVSEVVEALPVVEETPVEMEVVPQAVPDAVEAPSQMAEPAAAKKPKAARSGPDASAHGKAGKQPPRLQETAAEEAAVVKPAAMASVSIAVTPWGEVYVDGKMQGVSPPLDELQVTPGEHEIEIRNTSFQPYTLSVQLKENEKMKIRHKFVN